MLCQIIREHMVDYDSQKLSSCTFLLLSSTQFTVIANVYKSLPSQLLIQQQRQQYEAQLRENILYSCNCTFLSLLKQTCLSINHFCEVMCCGKGCMLRPFYIRTHGKHSLEESSVVIATIGFFTKAFSGQYPRDSISSPGTAIV